jgi:NTE family protein
VTFEAGTDVPLVAAVAASSCVSSIVPAVPIKGRFYIDGGAGSSSNADVLLGTGVDRAVFIGPFGGPNSPPMLPIATSMPLAAEQSALAAAGIPMLIITPGPRLAEAVGTDFLNPGLRRLGIECGSKDGAAWAERVKAHLA